MIAIEMIIEMVIHPLLGLIGNSEKRGTGRWGGSGQHPETTPDLLGLCRCRGLNYVPMKTMENNAKHVS